MGPTNHVLDAGPDPPLEGAIFWETGAHSKVQGHSTATCAKNGWIDRHAVWIVISEWPKES